MNMPLQKLKDGIIMGIGFMLILGLTGISYAAFNALTANKSAGNSLLSSEWNTLVNNQNDLKASVDGFVDTNTQLSETEVDNFVADNGYLTGATLTDEYNSSELLTNKTWFGDPIYRKVVTLNVNGSVSDILTPINNVDQMVSLEVIARFTNGITMYGERTDSSNYFRSNWKHVDGDLRFQSLDNRIDLVYIIIEYTKTP